MHPLGQLINDRMRHPDNNWSLDDVVRRAEAQGEKLGRSNLDKLRKERPKSLTRATLLALAAGLGVTPLTVANAALESMDIDPRPAEVTDAVATINIDPTLSDANRRALVALIREMRQDPLRDQRLTRLRSVAADAPPPVDLADAARKAPPGYTPGKSEQGDASDGGS